MNFLYSLMLSIALPAIAQASGYIPDYNFQVSDLARMGINKESVFNSLERNIIDLERSICANRAHLWAYDMKRKHNIDSGKIFIFFTKDIWKKNEDGWMYHVAPYIVENGKEYVMEASYSDIKKPLNIKEWAENETYGRIDGNECVLLDASDTDMTEYFYDRYNLPNVRKNGKKGARCYLRKVPGYYAYPASIAYTELKRDMDGRKVDYRPKSYDIDEVMSACVEAATTRVGRVLGGGRQKCKRHLNRR